MRITGNSGASTQLVNHQRVENQEAQFFNNENPLCRKCYKEPAYVTSNFYGWAAGLCSTCIQNSGLFQALTGSR